MSSATASTKRRSAEPSASAGVPTAMNSTSPWLTPCCMSVVNCSRPPSALLMTIRSSPGLEYRHAARLQSRHFVRVDIHTQHGIAHLGETGAGDQADIPGSEHCYLQGTILIFRVFPLLLTRAVAYSVESTTGAVAGRHDPIYTHSVSSRRSANRTCG